MTCTVISEPGRAVDFGMVAERALRSYVAGVAAAAGVGPESCTVDLDQPSSAYIALDYRSPGRPDRELALLWDERRGWSVAVETACREDLLVIDELGSPVRADPVTVRRFLDRVLTSRALSA